jgi:enoyl-CoA hydratase/carnithine racemase
MALVTTDDRGAVRVITYANPPIGTMTGAGSSEMFDAMTAGARDGAVRVIVITGGMPGVFIRHYDVGELSLMAEWPTQRRTRLCRRPRRQSRVHGHRVSLR